jgi:hypothetical protein
LGPPTGAEQDGVRRPTDLDVLRADRDPVGVDRDAAGEDLGPLDRESEPLRGASHDPPSGRHDLRADAVTRDRGDAIRRKAVLPRHSPSWKAPLRTWR